MRVNIIEMALKLPISLSTGIVRHRHFIAIVAILLIFFVWSVYDTLTSRADVTSGLADHWTFDTSDVVGSTVLDSGSDGFNGTIVGAPTPIAGIMGQAFNFVGSANYITFGDNGILDSRTAYTLSAWMKRGSPNAIIAIEKVASGQGMKMHTYSDGATYIVIDNFAGFPDPNNSAWHLFTTVYDGNLSGNANRLKFYLDGSPVTANSYSGTITTPTLNVNGDFTVGLPDFTANSDGAIDDVRIYYRALSAGDVTELYKLAFVPIVTTSAATSVTDTTATLNGSVVSADAASSTVRGFAYGISPTLSTVIATTTESGTFGTGAFTSPISSLTGNTTYYFRAYASNAQNSGYGSILSFTTGTPIVSPSVTTAAASSVATSTLTLNGSISATGGVDATQSGFAYGTSADLSSVIATSTLGAQSGTASFSGNVTGLSPTTLYYFRAYATNSSGTGYGAIQSTTTLAVISLPTVTTQAVSSITTTTATGNGNITSTGNSNPTVRGFRYGTSLSYGATTTEAGNFSTGAFTSPLSTLVCSTLYHVSAYATNSAGTSYGADVTFTTGACVVIVAPTVSTQAASSITDVVATLNGSIDALGGENATFRGFEWGTTTAYGATTTESGSHGLGSFTTALSSLVCNTVYHFRAYGVNSAGIGYGADAVFTTSPCPVAAPPPTSSSSSSSSGSGGSSAPVFVPPAPRPPEAGFLFFMTPNPTTSGYVTLHFEGGPDSTKIVIADNSSFSGATSIDYISSYPWFFGGQAGEKTLYVRFCNQYVACGQSISSTVIFTPATALASPVNTLLPQAEIPALPPVIETTKSLEGEWNLLPGGLVNNFVLAPLPSDVAKLVSKFPELAKVFSSLGITKISDLDKLKNANINLPIIADRSQVPAEIVVADGSQGLISIGSSLALNSSGDVEQKIKVIAGKSVTLSVRPESPAESIKGYLLFKRKPEITALEIPSNSLVARVFLQGIKVAKAAIEPPVIEPELLINSFEYTDPDHDGIYSSSITAPSVEGEYEVLTIINYTDTKKGSKELRMITLVDPEGYVYKSRNGEETRISNASVSIWTISDGSSSLWDASKYNQDNPQTTDVTGKYSFLVPEGKYNITAVAKGYSPYKGEIFDVKEGTGIHFNIEMREYVPWFQIFLDWKILLILIFGVALIINFLSDRRFRKKLLSIKQKK